MTFFAFSHSDPNSSIPDNIEDLYSIFICNPPYQLTLTLDELFAQNRGSGHPPRPQNAFILFRKDLVAKLKGFPLAKSWSESSKYATKLWKDQSAEVKQFFEVLSLTYNKSHKEKYPNYNYNRQSRRKDKRNHKPRINSSQAVFDTNKFPKISDDEQLAVEQLAAIEKFEYLYMPEFSEYFSLLNMS